MIIAIDGPAGSGKSTTAKYVAKSLGCVHINTGSMYRAIALKCIENNVDFKDLNKLDFVLSNTELRFDLEKGSALIMDDINISSKIYSKNVTEIVSHVSAIKIVRDKLVQYQREIAHGLDVVLEGRDIGTMVFPNAEFKFYLIAEVKERAIRRKKEMELKGEFIDLNDLIVNISNRDRLDSNRKLSPLIKAVDAIEIDTTRLTIDEQVNYIVEIVKKKIK